VPRWFIAPIDGPPRRQHVRSSARSITGISRMSGHPGRAVSDVEHDHHVPGFVDLVQHPPDPAEPGTVDTSEFIAQGLTDSLGVGEQRAGDELGGRCGDLRGSRSARARGAGGAPSSYGSVTNRPRGRPRAPRRGRAECRGLNRSPCGSLTLWTYAILYAPEEVGHEDHDVFRVAGEVCRDS
jgi:hypothetical protein